MEIAESQLEMEIYSIRERVIEVWSAILENFMDPVVCIFMCVIDIITLGIILVSWKKIGTSYETGTPYRIHADWFKTKYW